MYDVLSFFIGPMHEDGTIDHSKGHDYLGQKIGRAGQDFALNHWRWVDMQAYVSTSHECGEPVVAAAAAAGRRRTTS